MSKTFSCNYLLYAVVFGFICLFSWNILSYCMLSWGGFQRLKYTDWPLREMLIMCCNPLEKKQRKENKNTHAHMKWERAFDKCSVECFGAVRCCAGGSMEKDCCAFCLQYMCSVHGKARSANECGIFKGCEMLTDLMVFRHWMDTIKQCTPKPDREKKKTVFAIYTKIHINYAINF